MYLVVFRAEIDQLDAEYTQTAKQLRDLALSEYGCRKFEAVVEDNVEITLSWWDSKNQIKAWKENTLHKDAQRRGRQQWYKRVDISICKVESEYS